MKRRCFDSYTKPRSSIPTSPQLEMGRGKRMKFKDIEVDNRRNFGSDSSSISLQSSRKSHEAKTSEFAFFQKLKEVSGKKFTPNLAHIEPIEQCNKIGSKNTSNLIKNTSLSDKINENSGSSFRVENATPVRFISFKLQPGSFDTPKHSVEDMQRTQKVMEGYGHASRTEGTRHGNEEIFNRKRQKLCRWVTDTSFPEIEGLGLKGYDIVSKLLSRLIPESKENNNVENESDIHQEELQLTRSRDFTEPEFSPDLDDDFLNCHYNSSRKRILYLDGLYNHDNKTNHRYKEWESDTKIQRPTEPVEEIEEFFHPNGYLFSNCSNTPALGWTFNSKNVENNLSITFPDLEPIDDSFFKRGLLSLPRFASMKDSEISLPNLSSYHGREFGIPLLEDKEVIRPPSSNNNHLALSCHKSYFSPVKEHYNGTSFHNKDHWLIRKIFSPKTDSLISPGGLFLGLDWKCFPISGVPRDLCSSSYQAFEYPTNLSPSHCPNVHNEYENCVDGSCHKGTLGRFSGEAIDNVCFHDWSLS